MENKLLVWMLSACLFFGVCYSSIVDYTRKLERVVSKTESAKEFKKQIKEKKEVSIDELIKLACLESSAKFVYNCRESMAFKGKIKRHGLEKTVENTAEPGFYWVDLAKEHIEINDPNYEIPLEIYLLAAKKIGVEQEKFEKGHTDPKAPGVVKAKAKFGKNETEHYIRLIKNNSVPYENKRIMEQFCDTIRKTFTEEEYSEYDTERYRLIGEYYDELGKTLGWKIIFGGKTLDYLKKTTLESYKETKKKIYEK